MSKTVSVSSLRASDVSLDKSVFVKRDSGTFTIRDSFNGYEIRTCHTAQRIACYPTIEAVKKFLTKF